MELKTRDESIFKWRHIDSLYSILKCFYRGIEVVITRDAEMAFFSRPFLGYTYTRNFRPTNAVKKRKLSLYQDKFLAKKFLL